LESELGSGSSKVVIAVMVALDAFMEAAIVTTKPTPTPTSPSSSSAAAENG